MARIGVLALQGDFLEHEVALRHLGQEVVQVRTVAHLDGIDGLIIPGGESTTFGRLMSDLGLYRALADMIAAGLPVWGTCAGLILLARHVLDLSYPTLAALDIVVDRNAYGRQVDSFEMDVQVPVLGPEPFRAIFIRAPVIQAVGEGVEVLARLPQGEDVPRVGAGTPIAVCQGRVLGTTFHPELTQDLRFHRHFLELVAGRVAPI